MATFEIKMPGADLAAKACALVVTADGTGTRKRPRQVGERIITREIPCSGVLAVKTCALAKVEDGFAFAGIAAKPFKMAKGKATGVPKKGFVDLDLPLDFAGVVTVKCVGSDGEATLVDTLAVPAKKAD